MIPFMHVLTCINKGYQIGSPISILDLSVEDRKTILHESSRLIDIMRNSDRILFTESDTGLRMVATSQVILSKIVSISPYTALLLTRFDSCIDTYIATVNAVSTEHEDNDNAHNDAVVLRLEGNPSYIYTFVYKLYSNRGVSYESKLRKMVELLNLLRTSTVVSEIDTTQMSRLEMQANVSYWKEMLMGDYMKYYGTLPPKFDADTLKTISEELNSLGFYGFVNPFKISSQLLSSRVGSKTSTNIEDWVIEFIEDVVKSGGVAI